MTDLFRLRAAFELYGRHAETCNPTEKDVAWDSCPCGFRAALRLFSEPVERDGPKPRYPDPGKVQEAP